nr:unnamed protein product [Callosobruchus analis]
MNDQTLGLLDGDYTTYLCDDSVETEDDGGDNRYKDNIGMVGWGGGRWEGREFCNKICIITKMYEVLSVEMLRYKHRIRDIPCGAGIHMSFWVAFFKFQLISFTFCNNFIPYNIVFSVFWYSEIQRMCDKVNQAVDTWKEQKYQYYVQLNSHGLTVAFHQPKTIVYMSIVHVDGEEVSCTRNLLLTSTCCVVPSRQLGQGRTTELNHHSS